MTSIMSHCRTVTWHFSQHPTLHDSSTATCGSHSTCDLWAAPVNGTVNICSRYNIYVDILELFVIIMQVYNICENSAMLAVLGLYLNHIVHQ